jgi:hypothetical protein
MAKRQTPYLRLLSEDFPGLARLSLVRCWGGIVAETTDCLPVVDVPGPEGPIVDAINSNGNLTGAFCGSLAAAPALGERPPELAWTDVARIKKTGSPDVMNDRQSFDGIGNEHASGLGAKPVPGADILVTALSRRRAGGSERHIAKVQAPQTFNYFAPAKLSAIGPCH